MLSGSLLVLGGLSWNVVTLSVFFLDEILGSLEGVFESLVEGVESGGSLLLSSSLGLGSLGFEGSLSGGVSLGFSGGDELSLFGSEWVESVSDGSVGKWVLLGLIVNSDVSSGFSKFGLNLIGVDNSADIGAAHDGSVESVTLLFLGDVRWGTEDSVEGLESILGEDDESTEVTTWGELEDVKSVDVAGIDTWEVSSGLLDTGGLVSVHDKWTLSHDVSGVSVFTSSGSDLLGSSDLSEIITSSEALESSEEGLGVWKGKVVNDKWELWDLVDVVTSSHDKWGAGGSGKSGGNGMSSLSDVSLCVPFSPDLKWSEHSGLSAHVTEGSLTGS